MNRCGRIGVLFILAVLACNPKKEKSVSPEPFLSLDLLTLDNNKFPFAEIGNNQASVFVFLAPDCPLCEGYSLTINKLQQEFEKDSIRFYGIFPGTLYSREEMKQYLEEYRMNLPCILDPELKFTRKLGATVTPEVFLVDKEGKAMYHGRIDNWAFGLSKKRTVITEHNLRDALIAFREGKPIAINYREAIGCIIEYK